MRIFWPDLTFPPLALPTAPKTLIMVKQEALASRTCSSCGETKGLDNYHKNSFAPDGRKSICKQCRSTGNPIWRMPYFVGPPLPEEEVKRRAKKYKDTWKQRNPDKVKNQRLRGKYGITLEEYNIRCLELNNKCECCGRKVKIMYVDHCHETNKIRGYLCQQCNAGIGLLGDNITGVLNALEYLQSVERVETKTKED